MSSCCPQLPILETITWLAAGKAPADALPWLGVVAFDCQRGEDVGYSSFKGTFPAANSHASFPTFFPHYGLLLTKSKAADQIFLSLPRSALQKMVVMHIK